MHILGIWKKDSIDLLGEPINHCWIATKFIVADNLESNSEFAFRTRIGSIFSARVDLTKRYKKKTVLWSNISISMQRFELQKKFALSKMFKNLLELKCESTWNKFSSFPKLVSFNSRIILQSKIPQQFPLGYLFQ